MWLICWPFKLIGWLLGLIFHFVGWLIALVVGGALTIAGGALALVIACVVIGIPVLIFKLIFKRRC